MTKVGHKVGFQAPKGWRDGSLQYPQLREIALICFGSVLYNIILVSNHYLT